MRPAEARTAGRPAVAVLGARGFIGRAVVSAFEQRGVPVIPRTSDRPAVCGGRLDPEVARARTVVVASGRSNPALAERQATTVSQELDESRELFALLGDARRDAPGRQRVLLVSSGGAVYDTDVRPPYDEASPTSGSSAYARLKLDVESAFLDDGTPGSERTVLRLSNVYGPGQRLGSGQGVVGHWFQALALGERIRLFGDPETIRDYVYVDDVARAFVAAHLTPAELPAVLNVGSGQPTSLRELSTLLLRAAGTPQHPVELVADRPFDRRHVWLDVSAARRWLGWMPTTALETGLKHTWEEFLRDSRHREPGG